MKLTLDILKTHSACSDGVAWYKTHGEPDAVESCVDALVADEKRSENLNDSNWLLSRMLDNDDKITICHFCG